MKALVRLILALLVLLVFGCATASKTFDSSGRESYVISCDGTILNWGNCIEKAGEICGARGYDILGHSGEGFPMSMYSNNSQGQAYYNGYSGNASTSSNAFAFGGVAITRSMQITCK